MGSSKGSRRAERANLVPTAASAWQGKVAPDGEVIALPSGNNARVRRATPETFLSSDSGIVPDSLQPILDKAIRQKKGLRPQAMKEMTASPERMGQMLEMMDRIVVWSVMEPSVSMPPGCVECGDLDTQGAKQHHDEKRSDYHEFVAADRDPEVLYVDVLDFNDKSHIMNFAMGGTRDLERFRHETRATVGSLRAVEEDALSTQ